MEENKVIYDPKIAKCIEKERLELEPKDIFQTSIIKDTIGKLKKKKNHYYVIKNLNFPIKINDALCGTSEIKIFEEQTLQNELEKINNPEIEYIYLAGLEVIIKACFREGINTPLQIWVMDDRITSSLKSSLIGLILADLIYQKIKFVIQPNFCITTRELNKAAALKLCYKLNGIDMIPGSDVMSIECRILYAYTTNHEIKRRNTERLKIPRNFQSCVSIKNIPNDEVSVPQQVVIEFNKNKQKKKLEPNRLSFTKDKLILGNTETSIQNIKGYETFVHKPLKIYEEKPEENIHESQESSGEKMELKPFFEKYQEYLETTSESDKEEEILKSLQDLKMNTSTSGTKPVKEEDDGHVEDLPYTEEIPEHQKHLLMNKNLNQKKILHGTEKKLE